MKVVLGILLLVNVAILLWSVGQREFMHDEFAPATEFHPELMEFIPAKGASTMAKVTIDANGDVTTDVAGQAGQVAVSTADDDSSGSGSTDENAAEASSEIATLELNASTEVKAGQCLRIGPYKTAIDRGRAGRQLQDMSLSFSEKEDPQGRVLGYRVYQGPFNSKADVSRAKRRLEKQGVKDLYLIDEGSGNRFISLGFFSNKESANVFMRNFAEYKVKSKLRLEYATHFWLLVSDIKAIEKLKGISAIPLPSGISMTIVDCNETS